MKTKTLFLGSFLALVLSVGTFSGIKSNSAIVKADTTSDLGTFSPGSVNGGNGNGFYISMKAENDLPFDAGWSYLSVNTTQKCYLNSQACSVNLKKLDVNNLLEYCTYLYIQYTNDIFSVFLLQHCFGNDCTYQECF